MNWEEFNPVKAINEAQRKLELLSERNKEYERFLGIDRIRTIKELLKKPDFTLSDFNDSGMIFVLHLMTIELSACINTLDLFVLGMDDKEISKIKAKIDDLKAAFSKAETKIRVYEEINNKIKRKISFERFKLNADLPEPSKKDELLDIINGFIDKLPSNEEIVVPEKMSERYVPFDMAALEKDILKTHGLTVKQIGVGLKTAETKSLGIAVTFQACLHLDVSGKVELSQGVDDVLVRPMD